MPGGFDYTRMARRFSSRFPFLTYLLSHIVLWMIAYIILAILAQLVLIAAGTSVQVSISLGANLILAVFFGFFYGMSSGLVGWFFEKKLFYNKSLGIVLLGKAFISLIVFVILISVVRAVIFPYLSKQFFNNAVPVTSQESWDAFFYLLLIYNVVIGLIINFINQVNKKYGPGVLLPLLLGKYRSPKEEERIFLFMDLKSSTSIAEMLGHLKYSAFIRDSFIDINAVLAKYNAQIYQYVGDEIVITWTVSEGTRNNSCIEFFFACEARFSEKTDYYMTRYRQLPEFKAGLHMGKVTAVEVGDIKRDIAYHGDTLNTTARIQSVCNNYQKKFLTSAFVLQNTSAGKRFKTESIGMVKLKGKKDPVEIMSVEQH